MNIHFKDEELFNNLMESKLFSIKMGSHLYGLNNEKSDVDLLIIYANGKVNLEGFFRTHHQLQFKKDNVDYIFLNLQQFVSNILNGDSTINFEVLNSKEFQNSNLNFLYNIKSVFYKKNIIKSYLGLAKRDLKDLKKTNQYTGKKASHFVRGVLLAKAIIEDKNIFETVFDGENLNLLKDLKNTNLLDGNVLDKLNFYENIMIHLRNELNENSNKTMLDSTKEESLILNNSIYEFVKTEFYKNHQKEFINFGSLIEDGHFSEIFNY